MNEKIVYSDILKTAWKGLISQIWLLAGLLIGFTIIYSLLVLFATPAKGEPIRISGLIVMCIGLLLAGLFMMGYLRNCMQTLDREEPQFSAYGQVAGKLFPFLLASILFSVIGSIGFALLLFPGIYFWLRFQFFFALMIEDDATMITSFKRSWVITKGHTWRLFILSLLQILIYLIGTIAFGIGLFVAIPLNILMYACTYKRLNAPDAQ
jgi:uncharacterized membrane protein